MKTRILITTICLLLAGLVSAVPAVAQGKNSGQDTMNVMRTDEVPGDIEQRLELPDRATEKINLPESASDEGKENSVHGLETANEAREQRRNFGMERSLQSMEDARGEQTRQETKERLMNREVLRDRTQDGPRAPR